MHRMHWINEFKSALKHSPLLSQKMGMRRERKNKWERDDRERGGESNGVEQKGNVMGEREGGRKEKVTENEELWEGRDEVEVEYRISRTVTARGKKDKWVVNIQKFEIQSCKLEIDPVQ